MFSTLILYLSMAAIGAVLGAKGFFSDRARVCISHIQLFSIIVLVFTVGARIGADKSVISTLPSMGLSALVITTFTITGSILFLFTGRKLMGFDRYGMRKVISAGPQISADIKADPFVSAEAVENDMFYGEEGCSVTAPDKAENTKKEFDFTKVILATVAAGMLSGYFFIPDSFITYSGTIMTVGLCVLLFTAGIDMGCQKGIVEDMKRNGLRVVMFPVFIYLGTCFGGAIAALLLKYTLLETTTVAVGMGWATLAPILIAEKSAELSAVSFLANIMREFFAIAFIPLIAKKIGYIETLAPAGGTAMDTSLPMIERSTNSSVVICSFISGAILSSTVPLVTPILVAML